MGHRGSVTRGGKIGATRSRVTGLCRSVICAVKVGGTGICAVKISPTRICAGKIGPTGVHVIGARVGRFGPARMRVAKPSPAKIRAGTARMGAGAARVGTSAARMGAARSARSRCTPSRPHGRPATGNLPTAFRFSAGCAPRTSRTGSSGPRSSGPRSVTGSNRARSSGTRSKLTRTGGIGSPTTPMVSTRRPVVGAATPSPTTAAARISKPVAGNPVTPRPAAPNRATEIGTTPGPGIRSGGRKRPRQASRGLVGTRRRAPAVAAAPDGPRAAAWSWQSALPPP